ncbi:LpxL/LpxP family Kdo(2)-lipid IV(A) lauroyl/palmitoleoyl acyltransferase [Moritella viscosa]|uniref:LpxL/LpxP family Kdo(2)-lipid IV(A) lauroyl/palmitoleoyl acyltransferase n=1 Tax=Moritella viscosa TaxID=80854 RepID=UPI000923C262|nr:LpxL/LpxP family Kdo(2)-lipid IV(A) lauroyl/palmitoleoyl acyltransferase [Moritella viscosa]SGZ01746.1 Lipid A biosynthesis lauroyl acyltransferase [Moritella viscosa]SGZ02176.1 Lipid A biosynthesis lauroyl acyltransferase [Moritella viscosa]
MSKYQSPTFKLSLLNPKFWLVWFAVGLLALTVLLLPYCLLLRLGRSLGYVVIKLAKSRVTIVQRNLQLAFPNMTDVERKNLSEENIKNTGLAIIEMGIAWFWPNWRFKKHLAIKNYDEVLALDKAGRGVLVVGVHALNLEITARAFTLFAPGYGVYRPHSNPAYNFIQYWGRTHHGNKMIDRKNVKGMLRVLKQGGRLWYLPDQDYGFEHAVFVPFFGVKDAATTAATSILVDASKCAVITVSSFRKDDIYTLEIDDDISSEFPRSDPKGAARVMNSALEKVILRGLDQWMWLHRRFKTMPDNKNRGIRYKK